VAVVCRDPSLSGETHRGAEVGRKLIKRLGEELRHREIYDVGIRAPPERQRFFTRCGFGPDSEGAILMALPLTHLAAATSATDGGESRRTAANNVVNSGGEGDGRPWWSSGREGGVGAGAEAGAGAGAESAAKTSAGRMGAFDGDGTWQNSGSRSSGSGGGVTGTWPPPSLRELGEALVPGRTFKDGGRGLRQMLLREMEKAEQAAVEETQPRRF